MYVLEKPYVLICIFSQCALWAVVVSSVDVRINTIGHVTSLYRMDTVITSLMAHVAALTSIILMDSSASQLFSTVSWSVITVVFYLILVSLIKHAFLNTKTNPNVNTLFNCGIQVQFKMTKSHLVYIMLCKDLLKFAGLPVTICETIFQSLVS